MSKTPPVFRSISAPLEVPDEVLHALGDQLGVPKMVKPEPASTRNIDARPVNSYDEVAATVAAAVSAKETPPPAQSKAFDALSRLTDPLPPHTEAGPANFAAATRSPRPASTSHAKQTSLLEQDVRATPQSATAEKLTIMLPPYLTAALRRESAARRITIRTLVVMGLQSIGFDVEEKDLSPDFRRDRWRTGN